MKFNFLHTKNNIGYLTTPQTEFADVYVDVRQKEGRILSNEQVENLPYISPQNPHYNEWIARQRSTERFLTYLSTKTTALHILDVGCGNGWFTHKMATLSNHLTVVGLDVNPPELEQAHTVFKAENLQYVYADIFEGQEHFKQQYDLITLNACVQYFEDFKALFSVLKSFIKPKGEIHILDSFFYPENEIVNAKKRTFQYYESLGFPEMASNYFHHSLNSIADFDVLYRPKNGIFQKLFRKKDTPFMWLQYILTETKND